MPRSSEFFGIAVYMYFNDHSPAHFHAEYGEFEAVYAIDSIEVLRGQLPRRAHSMVVEWTTIHRLELKEHWEKARGGDSLARIDPLD